MDILTRRGGWLILGALLLQGSVSAAPSLTAGFASDVATSPAAGKAGKPVAFSVHLTNNAAPVSGGNVDLEVYNAQNKRVAQQVWAGQALGAHKSSVYHWSWKPAAAGTYTVKLGVFSSNWKTLHYWVDKAHVVKVS